MQNQMDAMQNTMSLIQDQMDEMQNQLSAVLGAMFLITNHLKLTTVGQVQNFDLAAADDVGDGSGSTAVPTAVDSWTLEDTPTSN